MENEKKDVESLRTVQRAIDILNCFNLNQQEQTLTEIASKINLAKSTTTRLLATLEQSGFVMKNVTTLKYKLGQQLYYLGHIAGKSIQIRELAKPIMDELRDLTKETVNLHVLEKDYRVLLEQSEGTMAIRHQVVVGERLPLWAGAGGKVILAYQTEEIKQRILKKVDNNMMLTNLMNALPTIFSQQFASSLDEREVGLSAVASPIFDINGEVNASLSVSGPSARFTEETIMFLKDHLKEAAIKISSKMGYTREVTE